MSSFTQIPTLAALLYVLLITIAIFFQLCLIAGAPWGQLTQGGKHIGRLPLSGRIAATLSIPLLLFMAGGISSAAGLMPAWAAWTTWAALGIQVLSTVANWATRSKPERIIWGPFTSVMLLAALCALFAPSSATLAQPYLNYHEVGTGTPVVLVHGFTQTHKSWQFIPVYDELKRNHRLISVDLRGHGESIKPRNPEEYGRTMALDLVSLLDELDLPEAHFVGFSLGAGIVGELLISHPQRVTSAVMSSGYFTRWDEHDNEFADAVLHRGTTDERYPWEPANQDFSALAAVIRGAQFAEVCAEQIAAINTPTLLSFGSLELEHMPPELRSELETLPESIQLLVIEGADHDSDHAAVLTRSFKDRVRKLLAENSF